MKLNHLNLTVTNPLETQKFLQKYFDLQPMGNPLGLGHTVTAGIVSAKGRVIGHAVYDDFLQTLDWPSGAAMSFALTALTLAVIAVSSRLLKRWGGTA